MDIDVSIHNVAENSAALRNAGKVNVVEGGHQAAIALLPYLQQETRVLSGTMRGGWMVDQDSFLNNIDYSPYQEYGTVWVAPTNAIRTAVDGHPELITEAFEKVTDDAASKAGFSR